MSSRRGTPNKESALDSKYGANVPAVVNVNYNKIDEKKVNEMLEENGFPTNDDTLEEKRLLLKACLESKQQVEEEQQRRQLESDLFQPQKENTLKTRLQTKRQVQSPFTFNASVPGSIVYDILMSPADGTSKSPKVSSKAATAVFSEQNVSVVIDSDDSGSGVFEATCKPDKSKSVVSKTDTTGEAMDVTESIPAVSGRMLRKPAQRPKAAVKKNVKRAPRKRVQTPITTDDQKQKVDQPLMAGFLIPGQSSGITASNVDTVQSNKGKSDLNDTGSKTKAATTSKQETQVKTRLKSRNTSSDSNSDVYEMLESGDVSIKSVTPIKPAAVAHISNKHEGNFQGCESQGSEDLFGNDEEDAETQDVDNAATLATTDNSHDVCVQADLSSSTASTASEPASDEINMQTGQKSATHSDLVQNTMLHNAIFTVHNVPQPVITAQNTSQHDVSISSEEIPPADTAAFSHCGTDSSDSSSYASSRLHNGFIIPRYCMFNGFSTVPAAASPELPFDAYKPMVNKARQKRLVRM